jgi:hypothetical protein
LVFFLGGTCERSIRSLGSWESLPA